MNLPTWPLTTATDTYLTHHLVPKAWWLILSGPPTMFNFSTDHCPTLSNSRSVQRGKEQINLSKSGTGHWAAWLQRGKKFRYVRKQTSTIENQLWGANNFCRNPGLNESDIFTCREFILHFFFVFSSQRPPKKLLRSAYLEKSSWLSPKSIRWKRSPHKMEKHPRKDDLPCTAMGLLTKQSTFIFNATSMQMLECWFWCTN